MTQLSMPLYTAEQIKTGEQNIVTELNIDMFELMMKAGQGVFSQLQALYPDVNSLQIYCGTGNNGGDGYIVAQLALLSGYTVTVVQLGDSQKITGHAHLAKNLWLKAGGKITHLKDCNLVKADLIVDALVGTGLKGGLRNEYVQAADHINDSELDVVSIDVPSGLCSDSGTIDNQCIKATQTICLIALKRGLFTGNAAEFCGDVILDDLSIEPNRMQLPSSQCYLLSQNDIEAWLTPRRKTVHKGQNGRVLCLGGDRGMFGAIRLASEACMRVGAGLTRVVTQPENVSALVSARPEVMVFDWRGNSSEINDHLWWADVIALGPGLGNSSWGRSLVGYSRTAEKPMVVDADGLNILANTPDFNSRRVITPHPGEAARLLNSTVEEVEQDRFAAARALQLKYGGVVVLKGAGTIVYNGDSFWVCGAGNPGMATGGMGDVLTGVIAGLIAQGFTISQAAIIGVWVHSTAADQCAKKEGERGLLASDLFPYIRQLVNL
ncbi:NAD(P)H-hydrate dehydratase [Vibrio sp. TH_r3]|uniref:NAD(P)H-hydrate dehydratase n=1 Tax=Vibrio sp. TH_r3 TaxID=3082084 RepID=UPI00295580BC|nr:NAD(P)H-hydrate dehydratase [Vibrio sp. TH_r3]MDV7103465.1 NAD(P)H-hydrate dehydratase [Vibrio sp. TH_r3]